MNLPSHIHHTIAGCGLLMLFTACNGIFDDLYDEAPRPAAGDLYVDASSWTKWYYIDLHAIQRARNEGQPVNANAEVKAYDIPLDTIPQFDNHATGIYTYWYDVFGEGLSRHELRSKYATRQQPEPEHWDIAIHRNNVRTNGAEACMTQLTDINQLSNTSAYATLPFVRDSWNETDVWVVQDKMLVGLIGNQRISINSELSKWLQVEIPPIPPAFTMRSNVIIVRFKDGTYAALKLKNYINQENIKCCLTIEYKYPL